MQRFLDNNKPGKKDRKLNLMKKTLNLFCIKDTITACYHDRNSIKASNSIGPIVSFRQDLLPNIITERHVYWL